MKKKVAMLVMLSMLVGLTACGGGGEDAASDSSAGSETSSSGSVSESAGSESSESSSSGAGETAKKDPSEMKIGVSYQNLANEFITYMAESVKSKADELGVELVELDGQGSAEEQLKQVESFITDGCDAIILNPFDASGCVPCVDAANEAGIPIVVVNGLTDNVDEAYCYVGGDTVDSGRLAMRCMAEALGGKGNIVVIDGPTAHSAQLDRTQGIEEVLEEYPDIQIIAEQTANWDRAEAMTLMENWLQMGEQIDGVVGQNDEMAIGALKAIQAANMQDSIKVVGIDAIADALDLVESGEMIGTVYQDAVGQGEGAVEAAVKAVNGEEVEKTTLIPYILITQENVAEFK